MQITAAPPPPASSIYFCDSPGQLLLLDRRDISPEKRAAIRALHALRYRYNLKILFFVGLWAAAGTVIVATPPLPVRAVAWFFVACCIAGLTTLMHEANHNLLFRHRRLNRWVGFLCGIPALVSVSAYRSLHLPHHAHTGTDEDPDSLERSVPKPLPMVLGYYLFLLIGAYLYVGHVALTSLRRAEWRMRATILLEYGILAAVVATLLLLVGFAPVLDLWLIPMMIAVQLTNVRGLAEHGLTTGNNPFTDTRSVISNRFVSAMMCNQNYHLDHHLFPGVPWYNLPRLHAILADEYRAAGASVYRSYTAFLIDFVKVTWSGVIPNVRLIPEHMRDDVCA